jgi:hypothetical protein
MVFGIVVCLGSAPVGADWVELTNRDLLQGDVISLDGEKLKLKSPNFGEMTIPRDRVKIIGFGERPVSQPAQAANQQSPTRLGMELPSLNNKQLNQLLQDVLGGGGLPELQQQIGKTKDDLKSLQREFQSTGEGDALDSYIQMFELFGNLVSPNKSLKPRNTAKPAPEKQDNSSQTVP